MDQDESKEAGSGQEFMTQVFMERQNIRNLGMAIGTGMLGFKSCLSLF